ncbi:MAG: hypothetical protein AB7I50_06050 [Vicinamibacterales bacterium]
MFTKPDGSGFSYPVTLLANQGGVTIEGWSQLGPGPVSAWVRSLTSGAAVDADHAQYWGATTKQSGWSIAKTTLISWIRRIRRVPIVNNPHRRPSLRITDAMKKAARR